jgi:hypothetical protein
VRLAASVRRIALRVVAAVTAALLAVWLAVRTLDIPAEDSFPYWLQGSLEHALQFFIPAAALLICLELAFFVAARLRR